MRVNIAPVDSCVAAVWTLEGLLARVSPHVLSEVRASLEGHSAGGPRAPVRPLTQLRHANVCVLVVVVVQGFRGRRGQRHTAQVARHGITACCHPRRRHCRHHLQQNGFCVNGWNLSSQHLSSLVLTGVEHG